MLQIVKLLDTNVSQNLKNLILDPFCFVLVQTLQKQDFSQKQSFTLILRLSIAVISCKNSEKFHVSISIKLEKPHSGPLFGPFSLKTQ